MRYLMVSGMVRRRLNSALKVTRAVRSPRLWAQGKNGDHGEEAVYERNNVDGGLDNGRVGGVQYRRGPPTCGAGLGSRCGRCRSARAWSWCRTHAEAGNGGHRGGRRWRDEVGPGYGRERGSAEAVKGLHKGLDSEPRHGPQRGLGERRKGTAMNIVTFSMPLCDMSR